MSKTAFATVGSTRFDGFVNRILSNDVIEALRREGYTKLVVQAGNSEIDQDKTPGIRSEDWVGRIHGLSVAIWKFKPSLEGEYRAADLVIGHAGDHLLSLHCISLLRTCIRFWNHNRSSSSRL